MENCNIATGVALLVVADVVWLVVQGVGGKMQPGGADVATGVALPRVVDVVQTHVQLVQSPVPEQQLAVDARAHLVTL